LDMMCDVSPDVINEKSMRRNNRVSVIGKLQYARFFPHEGQGGRSGGLNWDSRTRDLEGPDIHKLTSKVQSRKKNERELREISCRINIFKVSNLLLQ